MVLYYLYWVLFWIFLSIGVGWMTSGYQKESDLLFFLGGVAVMAATIALSAATEKLKKLKQSNKKDS